MLEQFSALDRNNMSCYALFMGVETGEGGGERVQHLHGQF